MGQFEELFGELRSAGEVGDSNRVHRVIFQMRALDLDRYYDQAHSHATTYLNRGQTMNFATAQRLEAVKQWAEEMLALNTIYKDEIQEALMVLSTSGNRAHLRVLEDSIEHGRQRHEKARQLLIQGERLLKFSVTLDANSLSNIDRPHMIRNCVLLDSDMRDVIWLVLEEHR